MIACTITPSFLPSLAMSSSSDNGRARRSHDRPVLPPIRDLFRELSSSRAPPESPALTLARLRVSDDEDRPPYSRPTSARPPSRSNPNPSTFVYPQHQSTRYNTVPAVHDRSRSSSNVPHASPYPGPEFQHSPRSMSYDTYQAPLLAAHPQHRNIISTYDPRHARGPQPPVGYGVPPMGQPPMSPYYARTQPSSSVMPPAISTSHNPGRSEDEDRTPIARYQASGLVGFGPPEASTSATSLSKYECNYCGKGFTRPSSLKIHLNSHTGEKPFVCPVDGCGRSFSVLSNMRRHARVHTTPSGEDGSPRPSPLGPAYASSSQSNWKHRRSASTSSSNSHGSHSVSSEEEEDLDRPEKRTRHHRK
ncbi:hypothetical protein C8J57DRAFT_1297240 [Mycena rebaudengoi]|nr:hypothetical protein C8J57DRAFT_1297240 [Mycena rebaudengoi]